MYQPISELVIDVNTWYRGHNQDDSQLLRNDGQRCCIGFLGAACGYTDEQLLNKKTVTHVIAYHKMLFPELSPWAWSEAYRINDDSCISDKTRRLVLKDWFKHTLNIDLKFSDEITER